MDNKWFVPNMSGALAVPSVPTEGPATSIGSFLASEWTRVMSALISSPHFRSFRPNSSNVPSFQSVLANERAPTEASGGGVSAGLPSPFCVGFQDMEKLGTGGASVLEKYFSSPSIKGGGTQLKGQIYRRRHIRWL